MTSKTCGTAFPILVLALVLAAASRVEAQYSFGIPPGYPPVSQFGTGYGFGTGLGYGIYATKGIEMGFGFASFATGDYETDFGSNGSLTYNVLGNLAGSPNNGYGLGNGLQVAAEDQPALALQPNYGLITSVPGWYQSTGKVRRRPRPSVSREQVLDGNAKILWPSATPDDSAVAGTRRVVEEAVQTVVREGKSTGHASIRQVVDAKNKLVAFSRKALPQVRAKNAADSAGLEIFIVELGKTLETMAAKRLPEPSLRK